MFSDKVIKFIKNLEFHSKLPNGIHIMNPFRENPQIMPIIKKFYKKYYDDDMKRFMIIGINPGRFGAGVTGLPFTDTKRLKKYCDIEIGGIQSHELSSVYIYDLIEAYGGVEKFYEDFYFGAMCPLGFTKTNEKGREVNYNYYDSRELFEAVESFIINNLEKQINFGIRREVCYCLGSKNAKYLKEINETKKFFDKIIVLEHPRYIMQYRLKRKDEYIDKYLRSFREG